MDYYFRNKTINSLIVVRIEGHAGTLVTRTSHCQGRVHAQSGWILQTTTLNIHLFAHCSYSPIVHSAEVKQRLVWSIRILLHTKAKKQEDGVRIFILEENYRIKL